MIDIRNMARAVNDRLKKLILPEDDDDQVTDVVDSNQEFIPKRTRRDCVTSQTSTNQLGSTNKTPKPQPPPVSISNSPPVINTTNQTTSQADQKSREPIGTSSTPPKPATQESTPTVTSSSDVTPSSDGGGGTKLPAQREAPKLHLLTVLGVLIPHMKYTQQETRMETLRWIMWLHEKLPKRVCRDGGREGQAKQLLFTQ